MNDKDLQAMCERIQRLEAKIKEVENAEFINLVIKEIFDNLINYLINVCNCDLTGNRILGIYSIIYDGFEKLRQRGN